MFEQLTRLEAALKAREFIKNAMLYVAEGQKWADEIGNQIIKFLDEIDTNVWKAVSDDIGEQPHTRATRLKFIQDHMPSTSNWQNVEWVGNQSDDQIKHTFDFLTKEWK